MNYEYVWTPSDDFIHNSNIYRFLKENGFSDFKNFLKKTVSENTWFWSLLEKDLETQWDSPYFKVAEADPALSQVPKWFTGGRFNLSNQLLDYNISKGFGNKEAIFCQYEFDQRQSVSYNMLYHSVSSMAKLLIEIGVVPGERIGLISPLNIEAVTSLLAISRIGAIAVPVFSGFGKEAIYQRFYETAISGCITFDNYFRKGKAIFHTPVVEGMYNRIPSLRFIVRTGEYKLRETFSNSEIKEVDWSPDYSSSSINYIKTSCEEIFEILYTSGTTGKPKGTIHTHIGSYLQPSKEGKFNFDMKPSDRVFWYSDLGWVMGTWSIISTLSSGGTLMLMVGSPDFPTKQRYYDFINNFEVTIAGVSPTLIRSLKNETGSIAEGKDFSSLRMIGSGGEPWDYNSYMWLFEKIGKKKNPIINLSGGTEIMGSFLIPIPILPIKACSLQSQGLGMDVDSVDDSGKSVRGKVGHLVLRKPVPSMTKGLWKDNERFINTYFSKFPGIWFHGDFSLVDEDSQWYILGRSDDVIKTSGKRIGPSEIEEIILKLPGIIEAAAIGIPDKIKGESIICFVVSSHGETTEEKILSSVEEELGKSFTPKSVFFVNELPKTNSGKISREAIRAIFWGNSDTIRVLNISNPETLKNIFELLEDNKMGT